MERLALEARGAGELPAARDAVHPRVHVRAVLLAPTHRDVIRPEGLDGVRHAVRLEVQQRQVEVQARAEIFRCHV
jgi:hypothetical protein